MTMMSGLELGLLMLVASAAAMTAAGFLLARKRRAGRGLEALEVSSVITLTRRDSVQLLDRLEHPRPRTPKFLEAMERHKATVKGEGGRE